MIAWLEANFVNLALVLLVALVVVFLIRGLVRDRKAGKSACGGNCASCGACSGCVGCAGVTRKTGAAK